MFDQDAHSWPTFDTVILRVAHLAGAASVLDVGAGGGKYGRLLREAGIAGPLTAIEIDKEIVERNGLTQVYDEVVPLDAHDAMKKLAARQFDLCIIGDCIEHMLKSEGLNLLNFLNYRCQYMVVVAPEAMPMSRENFYSGHNSVWTDRDFAWHDNWAYGEAAEMQLFILRGYRPSKITMADLCAKIVEEQHIVSVPGEPKYSKPLRLEHTDNRRSVECEGRSWFIRVA